MLRANVVVQLDQELTRDAGYIPTIQVDIVGVNKGELPQWKAYSMGRYWSPGDSLRAGADKYEIRFGQTRAAKQTLERTNPIYDTWLAKTASHLFILADLPDVQDGAGRVDPRRLVLPLNPKAWKLKNNTIVVTIRAAQLLPAPAPSKDL
jgi:hypothetical protein